MKRLIVLILGGLLLGTGGAYYYYKFGGNPETRRERALAKAREYVKQSKLNEALIEFQNAVKADPRSARARYEFANVLLTKGNVQQAYNELVRAVDLEPDFKEARFQLGTLLVLGNDLVR